MDYKNAFNPVLRCLGLSELSKDVVRKIAHVMEFFLLTVLITNLFDGKIFRSFYIGFTIAFIDESIQVISGRGALITDVWIDLIGVVSGIAVGLLICRVSSYNHFDKNKESFNNENN